jgi:hypothetical protein
LRRLSPLIILLLFFIKNATAQFSDSVHYFVAYSATGIINTTQTGKSYVFNNLLRANVNKNDVSFNSGYSWIYGKQNAVRSNNDFNVTADIGYRKDSSRFEYWALANYDKSLSLLINHRLQYGGGLSYDIIKSNNNRLNVSNGILYENSNLRLDNNVMDIYQTWRNSLRLKYYFHIRDIIALEGVHFLQNSFSMKTDFIVKSYSSLTLKIYRWVNFTTALTYNKLNRLKRENLLLTVGLSFEKYF